MLPSVTTQAALAILAVRVPHDIGKVEAAPQGTFWHDFRAGIGFLVTSRVLMILLMTIILVTVGDGAINSLGIFFVAQNLHTSSTLFGLLDGALGIGAVVGAILASLFASKLGEVRVFWLGPLASGVSIVLFSRVSNFLLAVAVIGVLGMMNGLVTVVSSPLLYHVTPREFLGRVSGILNPVQALTSIVSVAVAGTLASALLRGFHETLLGVSFGPIDTILSTSGLSVIAGGLYAMVSLRHVTLDKTVATVLVTGIQTAADS